MASSSIASSGGGSSGDAELVTVSTSLYDDGDFEDLEDVAGRSPPRSTQHEVRPPGVGSAPPVDEQQMCGDPPVINSEYDDDNFEDENDGDAEQDEHVSYSDDGFEDADAAVPDLLAAEDAPYGDDRFETASDDAVSISRTDAEGADERETRAQEVPIDAARVSDPLLRQWCSGKIEALAARSSRSPTPSQPTSTPRLPPDALHGLLAQLRRSSGRERDVCMPNALRSPAAPPLPREFARAMLANAKTQRLLHVSFDHLVASADSDLAAPTRATHLGTFCGAKRASLEGKLATRRFESAWTRSCTHEPSAPQQMSISTLEFVEELVAAQRLALAAAGGGAAVFSCMQTRALTLDRTVEATRRCLHESQLLRKRAAKVLVPRQPRSQATAATSQSA